MKTSVGSLIGENTKMLLKFLRNFKKVFICLNLVRATWTTFKSIQQMNVDNEVYK